MYACLYDFLPHIASLTGSLWREPARVGALERQLATLQVADNDDDEEEGAEEDVEDGAEGDDEDGDDDEEW